jgi:hypothetical protein
MEARKSTVRSEVTARGIEAISSTMGSRANSLKYGSRRLISSYKRVMGLGDSELRLMLNNETRIKRGDPIKLPKIEEMVEKGKFDYGYTKERFVKEFEYNLGPGLTNLLHYKVTDSDCGWMRRLQNTVERMLVVGEIEQDLAEDLGQVYGMLEYSTCNCATAEFFTGLLDISPVAVSQYLDNIERLATEELAGEPIEIITPVDLDKFGHPHLERTEHLQAQVKDRNALIANYLNTKFGCGRMKSSAQPLDEIRKQFNMDYQI